MLAQYIHTYAYFAFDNADLQRYTKKITAETNNNSKMREKSAGDGRREDRSNLGFSLGGWFSGFYLFFFFFF